MHFCRYAANPWLLETNSKIWRTFISTTTVNGSPVQLGGAGATAKVAEHKSFVLNMFKGTVIPDQVFPYPDLLNSHTKAHLKALIEPVEKFLKEKNNPLENDAKESVPAETLQHLWNMGMFGLQVPQEWGGQGLTNTQYTRFLQLLGAQDLGLAVIMTVHQSIGFKGISLFGTQQQKEKYLPRVTSGELSAFCLTEIQSGSDAASVQATAELDTSKQFYVLNGTKIWVTNGDTASVMTVFAKTKDRMTAFIVERSFGGVTHGPPIKKMGVCATNTSDVTFKDVKVPIDNVLGGIGNGFKVAMHILNDGRFGVSAFLSGSMSTCIKRAVEFATARKQFGVTLSNYQGMQEKISTMTMIQYATESLAFMVAGNMDIGFKNYQFESAISKCFASDYAWYVGDEAVQILGGKGYLREYGMEIILRDLRLFRLLEGSNEVLKLLIALNGIKYASSQMRGLQKVLRAPIAGGGGTNVFANLAGKKKKSPKPKGVSTNQLEKLVHPELHESAKYIATCISNFSVVTERIIEKYHQSIVREQMVLNRLADVAILIYTATVVLSRATKSLHSKQNMAAHERMMADAFCLYVFNKIDFILINLQDKKNAENAKNLMEIAKNVCKYGGVCHENPVGL